MSTGLLLTALHLLQVTGTVAFSCHVRATDSKVITLENPTTSAWQLKPVIQNTFWTGPETLSVPAKGKTDFKLTFAPLAMTADTSHPHSGSVFFPIPDGTGRLYRLEGTAAEPTPVATITRFVPLCSQGCFPCKDLVSSALQLSIGSMRAPKRVPETTKR